MGGGEKKHGLRRVGAWCARLIAHVSKHSHANKKQHADNGSPETENESWVTTTQRTNRFSSCDYYNDGASITTETDRAPSVLYPVRRATRASSRSNSSSSTSNSRRNRVSQRQDKNSTAKESTVHAESRESGDTLDRESTRDELSLIASQRLHVAGLYVRAQHLKRKKLRELSYEKSMQKPLSHIQVRRRLSREKEEMATSGTVITPAFVCIRKAELRRDVHRRLQICGFNADDSVPPWLPSAATAGRWSCELAVGSPRSVASAVLDQKLHSAGQAAIDTLRPPPPTEPSKPQLSQLHP